MDDLAHAQTPPVKYAPIGGKVTIYAASDGAAIQRWPVDARVMVASGEYTWSPPGEALPPPAWARGIQEHAALTADPSAATAPAASVADVLLPPPGPKMTPLGEREIATHSSQAGPAAPYVHPQGYTGQRGDKRDRGRR